MGRETGGRARRRDQPCHLLRVRTDGRLHLARGADVGSVALLDIARVLDEVDTAAGSELHVSAADDLRGHVLEADIVALDRLGVQVLCEVRG